MPKRSYKDHDFATVARSIVERAIAEKLDGTPPEIKDKGKNPAAVALGKLGGKKGGKARPHSSLGYQPPAPEAWLATTGKGCGEVGSAQRFPLLHAPDDGNYRKPPMVALD